MDLTDDGRENWIADSGKGLFFYAVGDILFSTASALTSPSGWIALAVGGQEQRDICQSH